MPGPQWQDVLAPQGPWAGLVTAGSTPAGVARICVGLAYLAVPFAAEVQLRGVFRADRAVRLTARAEIEALRLWLAGCVAVCPALQRAGMAAVSGLVGAGVDALDDAAWADLSDRLRGAARVLVVPQVQGWDRCPAVLADVRWALSRNVPVHVYAERAS
jgi:hypothetical protein